MIQDSLYIHLPESMSERINIIYDRSNDSIMYKYIKGPRLYPEVWSPYNTKF